MNDNFYDQPGGDIAKKVDESILKDIEEEAKKPLKFKARKEIRDGKEILVIDPIVEEITYPCGRQDVIVHAPSLELINQFKSAHNIQ